MTQGWVSGGIGLLFGIAMLAGNIGGMRSLVAASVPSDALVFLAG
jgi:hypothetical protein